MKKTPLVKGGLWGRIHCGAPFFCAVTGLCPSIVCLQSKTPDKAGIMCDVWCFCVCLVFVCVVFVRLFCGGIAQR
jgi:hypothetical protein